MTMAIDLRAMEMSHKVADYSDFDYTFTDRELQDILGMIEQKATGAESADALEFLSADTGVYPAPLALQFQPHEAPGAVVGGLNGMSASSGPATRNDLTMPPQPSPDQQQYLAVTHMMNAAGLNDTLLSPNTAAPAVGMVQGIPPAPLSPGVVPGGLAQPFSMTSGVAPAYVQYNPQVALAGPAMPTLPLKAFKEVAADVDDYGMHGTDQRGQVSHSTVEKQRRDRINSLIDELRDLVPPQRTPARSDGLESRRPKHVVLADTISLLKRLQTKVTSADQQDQSPGVKEEQANSDGGQSNSQDDMDHNMHGAPQLPHIPCQPTQTSGVTVEKGADCYYVQVKCRDRRGLLSDIINALKLLPLEIRTAAVTTTGDGTVRDVFEVKADDAAMQADEIQNMVHDALFQQHLVSFEQMHGKRQRGSNC